MTVRARVRAFALCVAALGVAADAHGQDPTRVVIRRAEIESAGWLNIGEMLTGAAGWQRTTLDAVWLFLSPDGLPPGGVAPAEPDWVLLIDGQRVVSAAYGARLLELLPLSPAQVESVTVTRVPRLVAGTIAGRGMVEFHTRRPNRGPAVAGAWHSGNVTGDPGPYAFTPIGGENVDRLGPYNHALASFGGAGWDVVAAAHQGSSHITHRGLRQRFDPTLYDQLGVHKWAPYDAVNARVGGVAFGGRHDLIAGRAWVNGPLFLPLLGGEQWLRGAVDHIGASGAVASASTTISYQLTHSTLDMRELPSPFPFVAAHSRRLTSGVVDLAVGSNRGQRARIGAGAARWSLDRDPTSAARTDVTLFADLAADVGRSVNELSGALARSSGGPLVGKGVLRSQVGVDSLTVVSVALSAVQYATGDDGTWIDRALLALDTARRERDLRAWADLGVMRRLQRGWLVDVGVRAGTVTGIRLLEPTGVPHASADGGLVEVRAGVARPPTLRFPVARIAYRYATPVGGDADVSDALQSAPAHMLEGSLAATVAGDFRVGGFLYVASRAHWPALRGGPAAPVALSSIARLDLSAEKWFWRRRVRTQFILRNVLDGPERYHPLGADLPLRAHIAVELRVPGRG